jgi:protein-tyrosine phosphatase
VRRWVRRIVRRVRRSVPVNDRLLRFEGMVNFRDLGGLPAEGGTIRRGRLFRSDSLAYATPSDARRLTGELGLTTIIDLRGLYEVEHLGRGPLAQTPVVYVSAPIVDVSGAGDMAGHYLAMLDEKGGVLGSMIRLIAGSAALPAVFHCEAGCDRTGVLAAVVLSLLGVPDEAIAEDYALTSAAMPAIHTRVREVARQLGLATRPPEADEWVPEAEMMLGTLKLARERWGGIREWAELNGVGESDIEGLRAALVEPPAAA